MMSTCLLLDDPRVYGMATLAANAAVILPIGSGHAAPTTATTTSTVGPVRGRAASGRVGRPYAAAKAAMGAGEDRATGGHPNLALGLGTSRRNREPWGPLHGIPGRRMVLRPYRRRTLPCPNQVSPAREPAPLRRLIPITPTVQDASVMAASRRSPRRSTMTYGAARSGALNITRHLPGPSASMQWPVAGMPPTLQSHR